MVVCIAEKSLGPIRIKFKFKLKIFKLFKKSKINNILIFLNNYSHNGTMNN